jgi:pimeloyl-ACP methyl ester carboxylesterase
VKVLYIGQAPYRYLPKDFAEHYPSVVTTPYHELVEPHKMHESVHSYVEEPLHAARCGFDGGDRRARHAGRGSGHGDQRGPIARQGAGAPEDRRGVRGGEDRVIPSIYGSELAGRIAGSRLEILERCGRIPHVEQLERTLELVTDFLRP